MLRGIFRTVLTGFMFLLLPGLLHAETAAGRFFLMGDGKIDIKNMHNGKEASVSLLTPNGSLSEEGFIRVDEVFGFPTAEKREHISPRLIFMLDYFSDLVAPGKLIRLESGYRSPQYNSKLRNAGKTVAKTSVHIDGMALDFSIEGVNGKSLWNLIRSKDCCGVGYYGGTTVHLDSSRPRFWEAATSKVRTGESDYNRRIYLSTDYDRYQSGDVIRLMFSSVSDFGFGIKRNVAFTDNAEGSHPIATAQVASPDGADCVMLRDRKASRFIDVTIPPDLRRGRYRIKVDFCERPYEQMPLGTLSNEIELLGNAP